MAGHRKRIAAANGYQVQHDMDEQVDANYSDLFACLDVSSQAKCFLSDLLNFRLEQQNGMSNPENRENGM